jgi:hypothetical protein
MSSESSNCDKLCVLNDQSSKPGAVPLRYLRKITNNFSDERVLGKGGTGSVYKVRLKHVCLTFQVYVTYINKGCQTGCATKRGNNCCEEACAINGELI